MAWAEKLASGNYRGGYRRPGSTRKYYVDGTFARKRDAREAAQEAEVRARRETQKREGKLTGRTTWGDWWDQIVQSRTSVSDSDGPERTIVERYVRPRWGEVPLNKIEQPDVQAWVDALAAGTAPEWRRDHPPAPKYVRNIFELFRVSIAQAVKTRVLAASPCADIRLRRVPRKRLPYITVDDARSMRLRQDFQDAVDFGLETGLRPGELCGLHAHGIDWSTGWLSVREVFVTRKHMIRPWPKDQDVRQVPLSKKALEILRRRLDGRDPTEGCGIPHSDGGTCRSALVFLRDNGKPMTPPALRDAIRRTGRDGGAYALRRGYATRVGPSLPAFDLARFMGHSSLDYTAGYVQETPAARDRALAALGEPTELTVVEQRGAERGANLDRTRPDDTARKDGTNAG